MAVESNGRLVEPGQNGSNGSVVPLRSKAAKKQKGGFSIISIISRLFTWYSIITILFRCPATVDLLTDSSPKICKPYFQIKSAIAPHFEPYYDAYAAPYIETVRPYYDTIDKRIIIPATALGKKYGAPRVAQAQAYGQAQWEKTVQPQVLKYQGIVKGKYEQTLAPHLDKALTVAGPYYDIAKTNALQTYYGHILPTYTALQPYALQGYDLANDFTLNTAIPYSKWALATTGVFLDRTVWPKLRILYGENVEPQLVRIGERLGRYRDGKKLKAAVDEIDSSSSASSASKTFSSISSSIASANATTPSSTSSTISTVSSTAADNMPPSEKDIREKAQKVVAHDLKSWQEKFAKAADEGSDELEDRITEITDRLVQNQAQGVGKALTIQLEEAVKSRLSTLKSSIISIVKAADGEASEESEEALSTAVRKAGVAIKEKAQDVRTWRQSYDRETNSLVSKAAQDTFEIIDLIRDSGLQEIGMRWAWTDGITHKDWTKYHQLKTTFDEWRLDVEKVATEHPGLEKARAASEEVESKAMEIAENAAKELARLKETGRWKLSAGDASDDFSTKLMPHVVAAADQKIIKKVSEAVGGNSQGTMESVASVASSFLAGAVSSASSIAASQAEKVQNIASDASKSASTAASPISSSVIGTSQGSVESVISVGSASASSLSDKASSSIIGTQQRSAESVASVKASASSIVDQASSSVIGTPQGSDESIVSVSSESASSLSAKASSSVIGTVPGVGEKASSSIKSSASVLSKSASSLSDAVSTSISSGSSQASKGASNASKLIKSASSSVSSSVSKSASDASSSISSAASSTSSTASKKVWSGAMAQFVEARQIVYEDIVDDSDDETFSEKLASMAREAGDRYSDITKAVSEAFLKPTSTGGPTVTKLAMEKYSSAISAASVALYGTEQGTGESVASSRYFDAVSAASAAIYGTPMPITDSIAAQATQAYSDALSRASDHYLPARSLVSAQISGEPKPVHQEMFSSVESAYSDSVASASSQLQAAMSAASAAIYGTPLSSQQSLYAAPSSAYWGPPKEALESISSTAASKLSEGLSAASAHYTDAQSYAGAVQTGPAAKQKLLAQMQDQYYAGVGMAHARYSEFLNAASSAVMQTQTPFHEDVASVASEKVQAGASQASSAVYGSETPWTESVASAASENWEALITKASSQIYGAPTPYFVTRRLLSEAREYASSATAGAASQYSAVQSLISELVSGKEPDFTESVYSRFSAAYYTRIGEAASSASSYASEAYASASSVVSSVFTPPPTIEAILDSASSRVNDAVEAASIQFYGTTKGTYEQVASSAVSAYSSAQSVASEAIYGSSTGYAEAAQSSISEAVASAQKAISEAIYGTSTGAFESATSVAGDTYASATSAISENISAATSYVGHEYSAAQAQVSSAIYGPEQRAIESAQARLSAAVESAHVKLAEFAAAAGEGASEAVRKAREGMEEFASSVSSVVGEATSHVKDEL